MPKAAAEKFTVTNGDIETKAKLDREDLSQYAFYITVRDCGSPPLTDSVRVTITIGDVNDNNPKFPGPYNVDLLESESTGSRVVQVKATGKYVAGFILGEFYRCTSSESLRSFALFSSSTQLAALSDTLDRNNFVGNVLCLIARLK